MYMPGADIANSRATEMGVWPAPCGRPDPRSATAGRAPAIIPKDLRTHDSADNTASAVAFSRVHRSQTVRNLLLGVVIGVVVVLLAAYLFLTRGMPVATKGGPPPLERFLANTALRHAMKGEVDAPAPIAPDEANLLAGAKVYRAQCEVCHGLPHPPPSAIASGM